MTVPAGIVCRGTEIRSVGPLPACAVGVDFGVGLDVGLPIDPRPVRPAGVGVGVVLPTCPSPVCPSPVWGFGLGVGVAEALTAGGDAGGCERGAACATTTLAATAVSAKTIPIHDPITESLLSGISDIR